MLNRLLCHGRSQLGRSSHFHASSIPLWFISNACPCCYVTKIFCLCLCFLQRFFVLDNGILKYSKSPIDVSSPDCNSGAAWPTLCSAVSQQKHLQRGCHDVLSWHISRIRCFAREFEILQMWINSTDLLSHKTLINPERSTKIETLKIAGAAAVSHHPKLSTLTFTMLKWSLPHFNS